MEPITRKEKFFARAAGQDVVTPTPETREEMFLAQIAKNGGGAQPDWNAAPGEAGHILNRTHYTEWEELISETEVEGNLEESYSSPSDIVLIPNQTYRLTLDGIPYETEALELESEDGVVSIIGNLAHLGVGVDNGLPFVATAGDGMFFVMPVTEIARIKLEHKKIVRVPMEYIQHPTKVIEVIKTGDVYSTDVTTAQMVKWLNDGAQLVASLFDGNSLYYFPLVSVTSPTGRHSVLTQLTFVLVRFGGVIEQLHFYSDTTRTKYVVHYQRSSS